MAAAEASPLILSALMRVRNDAAGLLAAQALRAVAYGFVAVRLGTTLDLLGLSPAMAGLALVAAVAGAAAVSLLLGRVADSWGRRRTYVTLYGVLAGSGLLLSASPSFAMIVVVGLLGVLSVEVVESGPFTTLEQAMLASIRPLPRLASGLSLYNAVATAAGALGALAAGIPEILGHPQDGRWFLVLTAAGIGGAIAATGLSGRVEADGRTRPAETAPLTPPLRALAALFALDSLAGGLVVQAGIAYWLAARFGASSGRIGLLFAALGALQTVSFLVAGWLAGRFGLLPTMVFTHLPSNLALAAVAFAPSFGWAAGLLLARTSLSQMDVPTRQTYVMALASPESRTKAAASTNTARLLTRPLGTLLAGPVQQLAMGAPFLVGGIVKAAYDLALWVRFRRVPIPQVHR